ncbi:MAG: carboxymuconolactone decarboxylase family protein [Nitrososphaerota archaeon]|nr:carboxymuconolactone decarboxylase family protein [Nitrososphaerota archaeon]
MKPTGKRIEYEKVAPDGYAALDKLQQYVNGTSLDKKLLELLKIRTSQLNGCAFCIGYHSRSAREMGETELRVDLLNAWRRSTLYSAPERAALAWTEAVTLISETHVPDEVYEEMKKYFSEKDLVDLTYAIIATNAWNRISTSMRDTA